MLNVYSKIAAAWLLMWAFSYLAVAMMAPWIGGDDQNLSIEIYALMYVWIVVTLTAYAHEPKLRTASRISLYIMGIVSTFAGIASWTGVAVWNVPFANKELFQISMAFADLISAVFMFLLALDIS